MLSTSIFYKFYILSLSAYIFLSPLLSSFGVYEFKVISILSMLLFLTIIIFSHIASKCKWQEAKVFLVLLVLTPAYLIVWNNFSEINLIVGIVFGYYASRKEIEFKKILFFILILQFTLVLYEYYFQNYIFNSVSNGILVVKGSVVDIASYGNVGFRPKGLFNGTLEATSFAIILSFIFSKKPLVLFLLWTTAIMTGGRLSIIIVFFAFSLSLYVNYLSLKNLSLHLRLIFYTIAFLAFWVLFQFFLLLQSDESLTNMMNVFNFEADSNVGRLYYMALGLDVFSNYNFVNLLFGNSGHFEGEYLHSAESGWINQLLNIGLIGFFLYLFTLFNLLRLSFIYKDLVVKFSISMIIISITIYRFETGFLRSTLLWFYIFITYNKFKVPDRGSVNPTPLGG
jgi:hypothetical protein